MANFYRQYMKLLKKWPADVERAQDFGQYLREQIKVAFARGEASKVEDKEKCKRYYESLERLSTDYHNKKYPINLRKTSTGIEPEICRLALSKDFQNYLEEENLGFFARTSKKLKSTYTHYTEKSKPAAQ